MKRGRMTGRQAQMRATAGSTVDQIAKVRRPPVKREAEERVIARARETATPLEERSVLVLGFWSQEFGSCGCFGERRTSFLDRKRWRWLSSASATSADSMSCGLVEVERSSQ